MRQPEFIRRRVCSLRNKPYLPRHETAHSGDAVIFIGRHNNWLAYRDALLTPGNPATVTFALARR